jgi:hypothetical protein
MNVLEAIFSFIFGDGSPNYNFSQRQLNAIGSMIRHNHGAVTAEQLKPYLDSCLLTTMSNEKSSHEEYVLPILHALRGKPWATDDGQLVYQFPHLKTSKIDIECEIDEPLLIAGSEVIPPPIYEKKWSFSRANSYQISVAVALGVVNLVECVVLGIILSGKTEIDLTQLGTLVTLVAGLHKLLIGYAIAYFAIPLLRYGTQVLLNQKIDGRNARRREQTSIFIQELLQCQTKLSVARRMSLKQSIGKEDIVFASQSEYPELELKAFQDSQLV